MNNSIKKGTLIALVASIYAFSSFNNIKTYANNIYNIEKETNEDNNQISIKNKTYISSLSNFYLNKLNIDKEVVNYKSTNLINNEIYDYLGSKIYYEDIVDENETISIILFNKSNKIINFKYYKATNMFYMEYSEDNYFVNVYSYAKEFISKTYYALDDNNDFYTIHYNNKIESDRAIYYTYNKGLNTTSISLSNLSGELNLFISGKDNQSLIIKLSKEEYEELQNVMQKYSNGLNLRNFLSEEEFQKYLNIISSKNTKLYEELISYNNFKKLKLTTL